MENLYMYIIVFMLIIVASIIYFFTRDSYRKFRMMKYYDVIWRWKWKKKRVYALVPYCPVCQSELWYDDENSKSATSLNEKNTFLVCEQCGGEQKGRIKGGDRDYAMNLTKREILRRVNEKKYEESDNGQTGI